MARIVFAYWLTFALVPALCFDDQPAAPLLEVTRLLVARPPSLAAKQPAQFRQSFNPSFLEEGLAIELMVALPGKTLIQLDTSGSKYTLTDNKGQALKPATAFGGKTPYFETNFSNNRTTLTCKLGSPTPPSRGAQYVHLQGELKVICAGGRETSPIVDLPANKGGEVKVGPITFKLADSKQMLENGKSMRLVRLEVGRSGHLIEKLEFVDASGKPVEVKPAGWMTFNGIESRDYHLDAKISKLQMRVTYYTQTEPVVVPLDLKVGVGL